MRVRHLDQGDPMLELEVIEVRQASPPSSGSAVVSQSLVPLQASDVCK
jgi:hypothetical protein